MLQLFTDTSANLPVALTKQHHITVVPFSYTVDGKETDYPDDVDFDGAAFYGAMRRGAVVKTSMVNPDLMANYFERALSQGDDVLYVGMSGGISGTAHAAALAAEELREKYPHAKIMTIDTYAASLGEGLQVLEAAELLRDVTIPHMTYGIAAEADLFARDIEITENGVSFELRLRNAEYIQINLRMTGMVNVYNALSAAACALILGVSPENVRAGLENIRSVPGRIEMLPTNTPYRVILDYAHAPDALSNILRTCRTFTKKRLIALFGCGGDRDKGKRPIMGRIGGELADLCILTSDNPRTEDPMEILREIEEGIKETTGEYVVIENRRDAIRHALEIGQEGDIIVLCGKGHETYQETMGVKRPFDEKVVVQELLTELRGE